MIFLGNAIDTKLQIEDLDIGPINDLAAQFGFEVEALKGVLWRMLDMVEMSQMFDSQPTAKERNRHLDTVEKAARDLAQRILSLPGSTVGEMQKELTMHPELFQSIEDVVPREWADEEFYPQLLGENLLIYLRRSLISLADAAQAVSDRQPKRKVGTDKKSRDKFIINAAQEWKKISVRDATYTTDWDSSKRGGDFILFLVSIANIMDIDPEPLPERFRRLREKDVI